MGLALRVPMSQLNLRIRGLPPSATVAINELSDQLRSGGRRIFKMGLGQSPFPVPAPVVEELRRHAFQKAYLLTPLYVKTVVHAAKSTAWRAR